MVFSKLVSVSQASSPDVADPPFRFLSVEKTLADGSTVVVRSPLLVAFIEWVGNGGFPLVSFFKQNNLEAFGRAHFQDGLRTKGVHAFAHLCRFVVSKHPEWLSDILEWPDYVNSPSVSVMGAIVSSFQFWGVKGYVEKMTELTPPHLKSQLWDSIGGRNAFMVAGDYGASDVFGFLVDSYLSGRLVADLITKLSERCETFNSTCLHYFAYETKDSKKLLELLGMLHQKEIPVQVLKALCDSTNINGQSVLDLLCKDEQTVDELARTADFTTLVQFLSSDAESAVKDSGETTPLTSPKGRFSKTKSGSSASDVFSPTAGSSSARQKRGSDHSAQGDGEWHSPRQRTSPPTLGRSSLPVLPTLRRERKPSLSGQEIADDFAGFQGRRWPEPGVSGPHPEAVAGFQDLPAGSVVDLRLVRIPDGTVPSATGHHVIIGGALFSLQSISGINFG